MTSILPRSEQKDRADSMKRVVAVLMHCGDIFVVRSKYSQDQRIGLPSYGISSFAVREFTIDNIRRRLESTLPGLYGNIDKLTTLNAAKLTRLGIASAVTSDSGGFMIYVFYQLSDAEADELLIPSKGSKFVIQRMALTAVRKMFYNERKQLDKCVWNTKNRLRTMHADFLHLGRIIHEIGDTNSLDNFQFDYTVGNLGTRRNVMVETNVVNELKQCLV